jgi:hypothetical protein
MNAKWVKLKMLKPTTFTLFLSVLLIVAATCNVKAETGTRTYVYSFASLEVRIEYPFETYPNRSITINITTRALATLNVSYILLDLYTLHNLTREEISFHNISHISTPKSFRNNEWFNKTYNIFIPEYAINVLYGKLKLKWTLTGTVERDTYERELTVIMSYLKSPELDRLRNENAMLKENLTNLNNKVTELNNTITELRNNLTAIQHRYEGELSGTRSTLVVLAVVTVFFVATTAYLAFRRPKQVW